MDIEKYKSRPTLRESSANIGQWAIRIRDRGHGSHWYGSIAQIESFYSYGSGVRFVGDKAGYDVQGYTLLDPEDCPGYEPPECDTSFSFKQQLFPV